MVRYEYVETRFPKIRRPDRVEHRLVPEPNCQFCAIPIRPEYAPGLCYSCGVGDGLEMLLTRLDKMIAATLYIPEVRGYPHTQEILDLKATGAHAKEYAWVIGEVIKRKQLEWHPDYVVTVPSGETGTPRAGTATFAAAVARLLGAKYIEGLRFTRAVHSQHKTTGRAERFKNISNSMVMEGDLARKSVLIVDDVATTLASILEASRAVSASLPSEVNAAVAGRVSRLEALATVGVLKADG